MTTATSDVKRLYAVRIECAVCGWTGTKADPLEHRPTVKPNYGHDLHVCRLPVLCHQRTQQRKATP